MELARNAQCARAASCAHHTAKVQVLPQLRALMPQLTNPTTALLRTGHWGAHLGRKLPAPSPQTCCKTHEPARVAGGTGGSSSRSGMLHHEYLLAQQVVTFSSPCTFNAHDLGEVICILLPVSDTQRPNSLEAHSTCSGPMALV